MSKTEHTPGPWICVHDHDKHFIEPSDETPNGDYIAYCSGQGDFSPDVAAANGDLIAAAPELLDALIALVAEIEYLADSGVLPISAKNHKKISSAREAIKKAKGEQ